MRFVFLGPPGAGKGTQAAMVSEKYRIPQISTGDILRQAVKDEIDLGKKAKQYLDSGQLVPDDVIMALVNNRLEQSDCQNGYILDGFPRTIAQARGLDETLLKSGGRIDHVIYFNVNEEMVVHRLSNRRVCRSCGKTFNLLTLTPRVEGECDSCGGVLYQRSDDSEETIRQRLQVYQESTQPLRTYYEKQSKLRIMDGSKPVLEVQQDILDIVENETTVE